MKIHQHREGNELVIAIRGDITETSNEAFKELMESLESTVICFDMSKVELINSLGARHWIQFLENLRKTNMIISFKNCSVSFIEGCNIYPKFAIRGQIKSFYSVYECTKCDKELLVLIQTSSLKESPSAPNEFCSSCKSELRFFGDWDEVTQFLHG